MITLTFQNVTFWISEGHDSTKINIKNAFISHSQISVVYRERHLMPIICLFPWKFPRNCLLIWKNKYFVSENEFFFSVFSLNLFHNMNLDCFFYIIFYSLIINYLNIFCSTVSLLFNFSVFFNNGKLPPMQSNITKN